MQTDTRLGDALMEAASLHAQWHHAISGFTEDHPLADWVDLLEWRAKTLADQGHRETAAALQRQVPEIRALWQALQNDARIQRARAESGDLIYQPHPPIDFSDVSALEESARAHLARMRGDAPGYQTLLASIRRFSAAIIPAWESTPGHEERPFVENLKQSETIASDTLRDWLDALYSLETLMSVAAESLSALFGSKNKKRSEQIEGILETLKGLGQL